MKNLPVIILLVALLIGCIGSGGCDMTERNVGTFVSITFHSGSWTSAYTTVVTTTQGQYVVRGRVSGHIGAKC